MGDGSGGRRTRSLNIGALYEPLGLEDWYHPVTYKAVYERFLHVSPEEQLYMSKEGFEP